ncbi:MAG: pseudouridylate synthase [Prevotellaceae bacterium]|jgi:3-hydroxymyristoyl/3-hydroxydecanoyl-(acyl carrier protein) dehydratase|nr:pseudouridylate synthase [Prevotellaceae bacterium]
MKFETINISELLPQRPPFVMVEKLLFCDLEKTKTSFKIESGNIFVENGVFTQSGIIENVAQTCAVRMGYLNEDVKIGMIGSINDFEFFGILPKTGEIIETEIAVEAEVGNIILLKASVLYNENKIATGKMKVVLTDKEI